MIVREKPWGREIWFAHAAGKYAGKILEVKAGHRLSLQYHERKHETLYLDAGKVKFTLQNPHGDLVDYIVGPGDVREIPPGRIHRMEALEDSRFIEVSTDDLDDVVRLEDDYHRVTEKG